MGILTEQGVDVVYPEDEESEASVEDYSDPDSDTDMDPGASYTRVPSDDTVSLYLREMSQVPLLNMEEEVSLAMRYEAGKAAREQIIIQGSACPLDERLRLEAIEEDGLLAQRAPDQSQHPPGGQRCQTL